MTTTQLTAVARLCAALVLVASVSCACHAPFESTVPMDRIDPSDWSPHHVPMEWWYVSAFSPEAQLAFHAAFFRIYAPPERRILGRPADTLMARPAYVAHLSITDLKRGRRVFRERSALLGLGCGASAPPLRIDFRGWTLCEDVREGVYWLRMGDVDVKLVPQKPAIVHPPGHSGSDATGRLAYQSVPRLTARGCVAGRRFEGVAWMDHQWGDQIPASTATWDWCGLHDDVQDADIMLYQVHDRAGRIAQTFGTLTRADGTVQALRNLRIEALQTWESPTGRRYRVALRATADGFSLETMPLRLEQEICSKTAALAYWEGPVRFSGSWQGTALEGHGMAECVHGPRR